MDCAVKLSIAKIPSLLSLSHVVTTLSIAATMRVETRIYMNLVEEELTEVGYKAVCSCQGVLAVLF